MLMKANDSETCAGTSLNRMTSWHLLAATHDWLSWSCHRACRFMLWTCRWDVHFWWIVGSEGRKRNLVGPNKGAHVKWQAGSYLVYHYIGWKNDTQCWMKLWYKIWLIPVVELELTTQIMDRQWKVVFWDVWADHCRKTELWWLDTKTVANPYSQLKSKHLSSCKWVR